MTHVSLIALLIILSGLAYFSAVLADLLYIYHVDNGDRFIMALFLWIILTLLIWCGPVENPIQALLYATRIGDALTAWTICFLIVGLTIGLMIINYQVAMHQLRERTGKKQKED